MQRRLIRDLLAYLPSKVLPALTAFITVPIFTRLFTPAEFGNYILAFGVAQLMVSAYSGYGAGTVRFYSTYAVQEQLAAYFTNLFASILLLTATGLLVGWGALLLFKGWIPGDLYPLLWLAVLVYAATAWFHTLTLVLRAQERSLLYTVFELGYRYGVVVVSLILVIFLGMDVAGLLWGEIIVLVGLALVMLWLLRRHIALRAVQLSRPDMGLLWRFAWPLTLGNFAIWGIRLSDRYVIEAFRETAEVGLYSVSYNISSRTIDLLVNLVMLVPAPVIMRLWEESDRQETEDYLHASTRMFFMLLIPAVVGIAVIAKPVVYLLADPAYLEGYKAVWLVALASLFWGVGQLGSFGMLVTNRTRQLARNQFIGLGVGILMNLLLVPRYGFMGAAVSTCVTMFLVAIMQIRSSSPMLAWRWPVKSLVRVSTASALMALVAQGVLHTQGDVTSTLLTLRTLGLVVLASGLTYGVALIILGEVTLRQIATFFKPIPTEPTETQPDTTAEII